MTTHGYLIVQAVIHLRTTRQRVVTIARVYDCTPERATEVVEKWKMREPDMTIVGRFIMCVV